MDVSKMTLGDWITAGAGVVLFISSFLTWFSFEYSYGGFSSGEYTESGWDYFFTGGLPALLGLILAGYVVATKIVGNIKLPELPVPYPLVVLGAAGVAALLVLLRLLIGGDDSGTDALDRSYGLFIATIAALALAAGAFLKFQEDGGELPTRGGSANGPGNTPPAPF